MSVSAIARRYAKALVQLGAEEGAVERFHAELTSVESLFAANPALGALFANPAYGIEAKREILKDVNARLAASTTIGNFLLLLLERGRLAALPQIVASFSSLADDLSGVVRPAVTTAQPLDDAQVADIKAALEKNTGKKVALTVNVDPALIGGIVTKIGNTVFDGSVKTQLTRIEDTLQKG